MHPSFPALTILLSLVVPADARGSPAESPTVEVGTARGVAGHHAAGEFRRNRQHAVDASVAQVGERVALVGVLDDVDHP